MKLKTSALLWLPLAVLACDRSPNDLPETERFWLTSYFGTPLPIAVGGPLVGPDAPGNPPACPDSMHAQFIELQAPATARMVTEITTGGCGPRVRQDAIHTGSFTTAGDTVRFNLQVGGLVGNTSFIALRSGNQLRQPFTIYTEAQPDGGGERYLVYQMR